MAWKAQLNLHYYVNDGQISYSSQHHGPLMVQKPFNFAHPPSLHHYVLHPPGGMVGGDVLETNVKADPGTNILITSPSAQKVYRSEHRICQVNQRVEVAAGATVYWLPQEAIFFDGSHYRAVSDFHVDLQGHLVLWEIFVFGRPSINEGDSHSSIDSSMRIFHGTTLKIVDRFRRYPHEQTCSAFTGTQDFSCYGQLIIVAPELAHVAHDELPARSSQCSWSRFDGLLQVRCFGHHAFEVRDQLEHIVSKLMRLINQSYQQPRIWAC